MGKEMKISEAGIDFIKNEEAAGGFAAVPYKDIAGFNTVGFGHRMQQGELYSQIDEAKATELLEQDLLYAENIVNRNVVPDLNQNQFDALVSFVYNVGHGAEGVKDGFVTLHCGRQSHMLTLLNFAHFNEAADEFLKWDHAGGQESQGLYDRRMRERELFLS